jgi:hypothetical protein
LDDAIRALRAVKDRVIERFEARVADEAARSIRISDAKETYYALFAATQVLLLLPDGVDAIRAHLAGAQHRLGACASALDALGERNLATELRAAFSALETEVRRAIAPFIKDDATPPPTEPPPRVRRVSPTDYRLPCSVCAKDAASFSIGRRVVYDVVLDKEDVLVYRGILTERATDVAASARVFQLLEAGDLARLDDELNPPRFPCGLDVYCPDCDRVYCRDHHAIQDEYDDGFYDFSWGTCPQGHRREVND